MKVYNENRNDFEASGFLLNTTFTKPNPAYKCSYNNKESKWINKESKIRRRVGGANKHSNSNEKLNKTEQIPSGSIQMSKLVTCKNTKCHC